MGKLPALILVSFFICFPANAQQPLGTTPIERTLGPGQAHDFTIKAEENSFIQLVVDQRGIDVVVKVFSPESKSLGEFDSPNGSEGPENVSFVAVAAGTYRISVGPLDPNGAVEGRYQIKLLELRQATDQELKTRKNQELAKAKGLALLTEIEALIPQIKSPQTRIKTQIELAQLLWETDEKRASKHLAGAIAAFKEYITTLDPGSERYLQQYPMMSQMRQEMVQIIAPRDPEAALNFLYASATLTDPSGNERDQLSQESALELLIANQFALKDPNRTLQIARQNLKKGFSLNLGNVLSELQSKKPELAAEFANEIAAKLLNEKLLKNAEAANLALNLLRFRQPTFGRVQITSEGTAGPSLLPDDKYRELSEKVVKEALSFSPSSTESDGTERESAWNLLNGLQTFGANLDSVVNGAAAAVEKKLAELTRDANPQGGPLDINTTIANGPLDTALEAIEKAAPELQEQLYMQLAGREAQNGDGARAKQIINEHVSNLYQRRQALRGIEQQEIYSAINKGKVEEALRAVATIRAPRERAGQLAQIATQIGPGQKRASAISLLEQARSMLGPSLQAQDDDHMRALFEIARAYSRYDSKRAFEIMDPLIDQLNDLCAAVRTLDGFGVESYEDDEFNMTSGHSVANVAGQMSAVLGSLALTNFEGAKTEADKIRLQEIRLRTYVEIAQQTIRGK